MIDDPFALLIDYGIAGAVILAFFAAATWMGKRLLGSNGIATKLADQHMEFVLHLRTTQDVIKEAIQASNSLQRQLVALSEESVARLEEMEQRDRTEDLAIAAEGHLRILRALAESLDLDSAGELERVEEALLRIRSR